MRASLQPPVGARNHSADVQIYLHIDNRTIRLAQAGEHAVKPAAPFAIPAGLGTLEIAVDGTSHKRSIDVPEAGRPGEWVRVS